MKRQKIPPKRQKIALKLSLNGKLTLRHVRHQLIYSHYSGCGNTGTFSVIDPVPVPLGLGPYNLDGL